MSLIRIPNLHVFTVTSVFNFSIIGLYKKCIEYPKYDTEGLNTDATVDAAAAAVDGASAAADAATAAAGDLAIVE